MIGRDGTLGELWQDLRYGWRALRLAPGFTAVAVLTLGLGIGANTAAFSVLDAVVLRPLPFPHPERLVTLWERERGGGTSNTGYANFVDWQNRSRAFDGMAALSYWTPSLAAGNVPAARLEGLRVTRDFFGTLGVQPALGRDFLPQEDVRGQHYEVILSYELWQRLGGDPAIVRGASGGGGKGGDRGGTILLDGQAYSVVGVLPRGFAAPFSSNADRPAEIWAPLAYNASLPWACRTCRHLRTIARLRPAVGLPQAAREMDALSRQLVAEHPADYDAPGVAVVPLDEKLIGDYRRALLLLMAAVGLVLAIACANVTSLMLARAQRRLGEMAVRAALGASRARIVRQLLTESLLLHGLGGALGAVLAAAGVAALLHASPPNVPRLQEAAVDGRVLGVTFAVTLLCGLVFGLVPAWRGSSQPLRGAVARTGAGAVGRRRRFDGILAAGDVALALVLLVGAGLVLQSLLRLFAVDPGFDSRHLLSAEITVSGPRYATDAPVVELYRRILERVQALPGVEGAAVTSQLPLGGNFDGYGITLAEHPNATEAERPSAQRFAVSPGYRRAMRIALLRGRDFTAQDGVAAPPVVAVSRTFAARIWPGQEPIGHRLRIGDPKGPWRTVVGVVGDVRHLGLDAPEEPQIYLPEAQWVDGDMVLVVRSTGDPRTLAPAVRRAIWQIDPDRPVSHVATMGQTMQVSAAQRLLTLRLLLTFAAIALVLAVVGIYGVLSLAVGERTREIGVRMALGAPRRRIAAMIVGRGALHVGAGLAVGTGLALAGSRYLGSLLFGVTAHDPWTYAALVAVLGSCGLVAAWLPARRAAQLDPLAATKA